MKPVNIDENQKKIWLLIIEKGRFAQWLGILMCGLVAIVGGSMGWLDANSVQQITLYGVSLAGGIELLKRVGRDEN